MNAPITIRIVDKLEEAQRLWTLFSPQETIYDNWEFRYCFYKYFNFPLFFYTAYDGDKPVGVLPLQMNTNAGHLEFFGGSYMEDNRVLLQNGYEHRIPEFYAAIDQPAKLEYIRGTDPFTTSLTFADYKFILPLEGITSHEDYIAKRLIGKDARELNRKYRNVEKNNFKRRINSFSDMDHLIKLNIEHFGDESSFKSRPHHREIFYDLLKPPFEPLLITYLKDNTVQAVSFSLQYKGVLESINTSIANNAPKNLREYTYLKKIDDAVEKHMQYIDFFVGDYGWKSSWSFSKIPQYNFIKLQ